MWGERDERGGGRWDCLWQLRESPKLQTGVYGPSTPCTASFHWKTHLYTAGRQTDTHEAQKPIHSHGNMGSVVQHAKDS